MDAPQGAAQAAGTARAGRVRRRLVAGLQTLAFKNVVLFVVIVIALVAPIAYTYLRTVEQLLTDTLAAEVAVAAQRGTNLIDAAAVARITDPAQRDSPEYLALRETLARIQAEFDVDNAVVMRPVQDGGYAYVADGNGYFRINERVWLHTDFPETKAPADAALRTGLPSSTGLVRNEQTRWFQVNAPLLDGDDVVGLLLINKFATPVAEEIARRQRQIVWGVVVVVVLGIVLWGYLAVRLSRPLVNLRRAANKISSGRLDVDVTRYDGHDEVGDLTTAFRQMVSDLRSSREQIEAYTQLLQSEKDAFFRFVPTQFLQLLGRDSPVAIQLGDSSPRTMSVLFSDIRSFTELAEFLDAQNVFGFLNEYLARMEPPIQNHGGFVDKFLGDGIMALFEDEHHGEGTSSDRAVRAAVEMRRQLMDYNRYRAARGLDSVRIGVGLHTGSLVLGTVGSPQRLNTTVVGDTVNLASRLESLTAHYRVGILVSEAVHSRLSDRDAHCAREIASVRVKGKSRTVRLFDLFDWEEPAARERKLEERAAFAAALERYRAGAFAEARLDFQALEERNPLDRAAGAYREQCERHLAQPPADWDGVDVFVEK
jgi:class 3 adenylate cyclase/HAMP domain-containing protein